MLNVRFLMLRRPTLENERVPAFGVDAQMLHMRKPQIVHELVYRHGIHCLVIGRPAPWVGLYGVLLKAGQERRRRTDLARCGSGSQVKHRHREPRDIHQVSQHLTVLMVQLQCNSSSSRSDVPAVELIVTLVASTARCREEISRFDLRGVLPDFIPPNGWRDGACVL